MKYILLSILTIALSCGSSKDTPSPKKVVETKSEEVMKTPEVITEEIIAVLKYPNRLDDAKQLIENSGLTWDKLIFDQDETKIALLKVPADKRDFWMEKLMISGEFKTIELNDVATINKITSAIEKTLVSLRKGACYGHCPEFYISIDKEGNVTYKGINNVIVKGEKKFKLTEKQFAKLKSKLNKTTFSNYRSSYNNPKIMDLPSTYISHNKKEIQLRVWGEVPTELVLLTEFIEDILLEKKYYEL